MPTAWGCADRRPQAATAESLPAGSIARVSGSHTHAHGDAPVDGSRLGVSLAVIAVFMVVEVTAAFVGGSLALLADAGHMLADAGALGMAWWVTHLAAQPARGSMTFGFKRAEILSAAANGVTLLVVAVVVAVEAVARLLHPVRVDGALVAVVAAAGLVANGAATAILAGSSRRSLNLVGAIAHLLSDVWAFAATLVAGLVIVATGFRRADPIASLVIVAIMGRAAWGLLRASGRILLEAAPDDLALGEVREHILGIGEVAAVHDLHAWVVTSDLPAVSAHVVVSDECFLDGRAPQVLDRLQECLAGHFDVEHSTFQLEPARHAAHEAPQHD